MADTTTIVVPSDGPTLIEEKPLTGLSAVYTSVTWTAGTYKKLSLSMDIESGVAANAAITLAGAAGTLRHFVNYSNNGGGSTIADTASWLVQASGSPVHFEATIHCRSGLSKSIHSLYISGTGASTIGGTGNGYNTSTGGVTGLVITFDGADLPVGKITLLGWS